MRTHTEYEEITDAINAVADEVNTILDDRSKERYFAGLILLYSLIENLVKWMVFVKLLWEFNRELSNREILNHRIFCKRLSFYNALQISFSIGLFDWKFFKRLDGIRIERNDVIHQLWLYTHRGDYRVLRKKLEKVARVTDQLLDVFNALTEIVGVDEVYELFL